jgi:hypothetical protein
MSILHVICLTTDNFAEMLLGQAGFVRQPSNFTTVICGTSLFLVFTKKRQREGDNEEKRKMQLQKS